MYENLDRNEQKEVTQKMFACLNTHAPLEFHSLIALDYAADGPEFLSKKKDIKLRRVGGVSAAKTLFEKRKLPKFEDVQ
jgi:hypothetical protein